MTSCIQFVAHGWVLWRLLGPGWWWSNGHVHDWPPVWAWQRYACPHWIYAPDLSFSVP